MHLALSLHSYPLISLYFYLFFFNDTATTDIYTLSLHDALPISPSSRACGRTPATGRRLSSSRARTTPSGRAARGPTRSEEHTSELQSQFHLVCRLLLEKKNKWNDVAMLDSTTTSPNQPPPAT